MVKHRKLIALSAVIALLLAAAAAWFLIPRNCFPANGTITTLYVTGYDDNGDPFLLTEDTDIPALDAALPQLQRRALSFPLRGYPLKEVAYEVNGICDDIPFCIVLREDDTGFIYHLGNTCYHLVNAKEWVTLLNELTSK